MFFTYRKVLWTCLIMTVFFYVPFYLLGWSTDVWTRFTRIQEWAAQGFPWKEQLMMGQNFPFGHEMHWTRPLDIIGYVFAWPFIPNYGLKESLEIMSYYVPLLVLLLGVAGFLYALRGYLTPKMMFISFWLFFWGIGYVWGQSTVGYYDHHVFHFTILMWVVAFVARSFLKQHKGHLMIAAGALTALGTWITAEFFINSYIVLVPFVFYWLFYNRSLKPAVIYSGAYTLFLLAAMSFDHPISGFWTLDFYRVSLFHVLLGAFNTVALLLLTGIFRVFKSTLLRRLIYGTLVASLYGVLLLNFFCDILLVPMADPFVYNVWTSKVSEMEPLYRSTAVFSEGFIVFVVGLIALFVSLKARLHKNAPMLLLSSVGLLFYLSIYIFHVRVGISVNVFMVLVASLCFNMVFFPREKTAVKTFLFLLLYGLFIGGNVRGGMILDRMKNIGMNVYREEFKQNPDMEMPKWLRNRLIEEQKAKKNENQPPKPYKEGDPWVFTCDISDEVIDVIKKDNKNGGVFVDIFDSPKMLWETDKPLLTGPYHTNVDGFMALFHIMFDRGDFKNAERIIKERNLTQIYVKNPMCSSYIMYDEDTKKLIEGAEGTFYVTLWDNKNVPNWLELAYHNKRTGEKVYRVK